MQSGPGAAKRPNVLVFIADQLRADHLGFAGNNQVRTPNLDALAAESVVFSEATVANPTCMPNRASLLTGRWPSAHGTRCNGIPLDPDASTFVRQLATDGYRTAAVGKLHHQNMGWDFEPEQREQIEETQPLLLETGARDSAHREREAGWDQWENRARHEASHVDMPEDYYGYQEVDLVVGHGDAPGGHYVHWARERGVDPRALGGVDHALDLAASWEQVYTSAIPAKAHPTRYIGERAEARVRAAAGEEDPFFLFVSFPDPHHPFAPPVDYARLYDPEALDLPIGFEQDHSASPAHIREMIAVRGTPNSDPTMSFAVNEEQYRAAAAAQYGLITFMDEQIGNVLNALRETGQDQDTIIVFTSDHGDLFGDHGLMLKHFVHYRAVTRVPLTIRIPGRAAGKNSSLVSSADLAPTLLELTSTPAFRGIQGMSLQPLLTGEKTELRKAVLVEEEQPFSLPGLPAPVRMRTVITNEGRMTRYFGSEEVEVYDHRRDPHELVNVASNPAAAGLRHRLEVAMMDHMARVQDEGIAPTAAA